MKKGNLNLSINSIVVLILAITMLGLGLAFMRNIFGDATEQFETVSEEMQTEMADQMKDAREPVDLNIHRVELGENEEETIYMGVRNDRGSQREFRIPTWDDLGEEDDFQCRGDSDVININYPEGERWIDGDEVDVLPVRIEGVGSGTCRVRFFAEKGDEDGTEFNRIGSRTVYIEVS